MGMDLIYCKHPVSCCALYRHFTLEIADRLQQYGRLITALLHLLHLFVDVRWLLAWMPVLMLAIIRRLNAPLVSLNIAKGPFVKRGFWHADVSHFICVMNTRCIIHLLCLVTFPKVTALE